MASAEDASDDPPGGKEGGYDLEFINGLNCELCELFFNSSQQLWKHIIGKKHQKAKKALKTERPFSKEIQKRKEVYDEFLCDASERDKFFNLIKPEEPIVGADYFTLEEVANEEVMTCKLCDSKGHPNNMVMHIIGLKHRLAFLKLHENERYKLVSKSEKRAVQTEKCRLLCVEVEKERGRGTPGSYCNDPKLSLLEARVSRIRSYSAAGQDHPTVSTTRPDLYARSSFRPDRYDALGYSRARTTRSPDFEKIRGRSPRSRSPPRIPYNYRRVSKSRSISPLRSRIYGRRSRSISPQRPRRVERRSSLSQSRWPSRSVKYKSRSRSKDNSRQRYRLRSKSPSLKRLRNSRNRFLSRSPSLNRLKSRSPKRWRSKSRSLNRLRSRSQSFNRLRSRSRSLNKLRSRSRSFNRFRSRSRSLNILRSRSRSLKRLRSKSLSLDRFRSRLRSINQSLNRLRSRSRSHNRWRSRSRSLNRLRSRSGSPARARRHSRSPEEFIFNKRLKAASTIISSKRGFEAELLESSESTHSSPRPDSSTERRGNQGWALPSMEQDKLKEALSRLHSLAQSIPSEDPAPWTEHIPRSFTDNQPSASWKAANPGGHPLPGTSDSSISHQPSHSSWGQGGHFSVQSDSFIPGQTSRLWPPPNMGAQFSGRPVSAIHDQTSRLRGPPNMGGHFSGGPEYSLPNQPSRSWRPTNSSSYHPSASFAPAASAQPRMSTSAENVLSESSTAEDEIMGEFTEYEKQWHIHNVLKKIVGKASASAWQQKSESTRLHENILKSMKSKWDSDASD